MGRRRRRRRKGSTSNAWANLGLPATWTGTSAGVLTSIQMLSHASRTLGADSQVTWTLEPDPEPAHDDQEPRVRWENGVPREEDIERARGDVVALSDMGGFLAWRKSEERARALLWSWLTTDQQASVERADTFDVTSSTGRRWRIVAGRSIRNCLLLGQDGRPAQRYCLQQMALVPDDDACLAQKLLLETDEPGFLALAREAPMDSGAGWRVHSARAIVRWAVQEGLLPAEIGARERMLDAPAASMLAATGSAMLSLYRAAVCLGTSTT